MEQPDAPPGKRKPRWRRYTRRVLYVLVAFVAVGVIVRLALPSYLRGYVNRVLDQSPEFIGTIGDIDVNLWRGAYSIDDVKIVKRRGGVQVPFFQCRTLDLSMRWESLMDGAVRGKVRLDQPALRFVHAPSPQESQNGVDQPWLSMINDLFPFRIDRADIDDGSVHFHTFHTTPPVHVFLSEVTSSIRNLTNIEDSTDPLPAVVRARGTAMDSGTFQLTIALEPQSHLPHFSIAVRLLDLDVTRMNSLARAYGDFDFEGGQFDFVMEASAKSGYLEGYAQPLFRNVQVISLRDLKNDDPLQVLWESLVGIVGAIFQNQERDQFGTRITFEGDLDNPRTSILEIIGNVLRNAFVRAYLPRIEGRIAPAAVQRRNPEGQDNESAEPLR